MRTIILNESQIKEILVFEHALQLTEGMSREQLLSTIKKYAIAGLITSATLGGISQKYKLTQTEKQQIENVMVGNGKSGATEKQEKENNGLQLVSDKVVATIYHAVEEQCDSDCEYTASMFKLDLNNPAKHRIIAIERTMMPKYGLKMGDVVKVEGVGDLSGFFQIQDKMNKRFANQDKIDILVNSDRKYGKWDNVKLYKVTDPSLIAQFKGQTTPMLAKK